MMGGRKEYKKVVIIDDDHEMVDFYNNILKRKNLSKYLVHFDNASESIDYLKKRKKEELPCYILLDLYMPEMDGFEFLEKFENLGSLKKNIEVYVCSSTKKKRDRDKVMYYQFVSAFIEKPLPSEFLELLIKNHEC